MRPAEPDGFLRVFAGHQPIEKTGCESIAASHAIANVALAGRRLVGLAVDPRDGAIEVRRATRDQLDCAALRDSLADDAQNQPG